MGQCSKHCRSRIADTSGGRAYRSDSLSRACRFLSVCLLLVIWLCGASTALADAGRVVRSGCELDYPPFCIVHEDGSADGFSVELMRAALAAMDHGVTFRTGPWSEVRGWLERSEIDALPLVGRTPEREALFDFTVPYITMHGAIVVRRDTTGIDTLDDLDGGRVATLVGDNAEEFLRRETRAFEIVTTPTFVEALESLDAGHCDAVVAQRLVALRLLQETGLDARLRVLPRPIPEFAQSFCFAVAEGDRDTLALLNEGLALVVADGTHRRLHAKWFGHLQLPSDRALVIGGDHRYPPFEFLDSRGRPAGFNVELTRAIAEEMGLDIQFRLGDWQNTVDGLRRGDIDVIQGMYYSRARDRVFDFSPPHLTAHYVAVVPKGGRPPPETLSDLVGLRVVVQEGDLAHDYLVENHLGEGITLRDCQAAALRLVVQGEQDCAVVARMAALRLIAENGWSELAIGRSPLFVGEYCYAVSDGSNALLAQFSEGLAALKARGEYRRIYGDWLVAYEGRRYAWRQVMVYVAAVALPLLIVACVAVLWSWSLRRQVARRTEDLRRSTEYQQAMVACSPVALYSIDPDCTVLSWNASAERVFGWSADEVLGRPLPTIPEGHDGEVRELIGQGLAEGGVVGRRSMRRRKDGSVFPVSLSIAPIRDHRGETVGIMSAAEDVSERESAEEALRQSEAMLARTERIAHLGSWEWDASTDTVVWSDELFRVFGRDPGLGAPPFAEHSRFFLPEDAETLRAAVTRAVTDGTPYELELRVVRTDGAVRVCQVCGYAASPDADGRVRRLFGSLQDITERREAAEALRRSEEKYRLLADNTVDVIWAMTMEARFTYVNPAIQAVFGYAPGEWTGTGLWEHCDPAHFAQMKALIEQEAAKGPDHPGVIFETEMLRRDGSTIPVEIHGRAVFDENAVPISLQGMTRDISERHRHEAALHQIEWMLTPGLHHPESVTEPAYGDLVKFNTQRTILDAVGTEALQDIVRDYLDLLDTSAAVYELNGDYACGIFASGWCRLMDEASRRLCGTDDNREALACGRWHCHESCWRDASLQAIETGAPVDVACAGGLRLYAVPIVAGDRVVGVVNFGYGDPPRDEETLEVLSARFGVARDDLLRAAIAYESRPPYIIDMAKNRAAASARLIGEMVDRSRAQASVHRLNGVLRSVRDINQLIVRERTPGSLIRTACSLLVEDRSYASALIILTGETGAVTDYAQAGMDAVFPPLQRLLDEGGLPPCCERIGTGETVSVLFDPVSVCQSCPISETCRGEGVMRARLSHGGEAFGFLAVAGDGDLGVDHEEQELFLEMAGDLGYALHTMAAHRAREAAERARERAEEHLHQTQRLESVGRLAGGVAHDFNNLLTGILNYVELCRDEIEPTHPIQEYLEEITRDAQRSADLTRQLLAFARRQTVAPRVLDLNDTVVGMLSMLRRLIGEDVDLAWQPCVDVWPVKIDPSQMDQILVNLCVNARDAINGVGRVTIETANTVVPPEYCMEHVDAVPGEYVTLAVSDDGCGMDEQTRLQVFEPFFSTKPTGEGTGLGLATVYGIVRQNGGFAGVYSEEGSGTTFRVYLPRSMADTTTHGAREADTTTSAGGTETLLLVEDEKSIRVTMGLFLRKRGYTVLEAASPEEALRLIAEYRGRVHLLITDVVMPGMSGRDLAERVMADDGQLRVLYMSGYTANVIAHRGILEDGVDFLSKPIDRQDLTRKVREILDR